MKNNGARQLKHTL
uniref:Uncharacterized protein n=1 Tax=Anguilla anguilla TaxID=7936 RepID=A0A0E9UBD8_ANGAN